MKVVIFIYTYIIIIGIYVQTYARNLLFSKYGISHCQIYCLSIISRISAFKNVPANKLKRTSSKFPRANINIIKLTITNTPTPKKPAKYITNDAGVFLEALCSYFSRYPVFSTTK